MRPRGGEVRRHVTLAGATARRGGGKGQEDRERTEKTKKKNQKKPPKPPPPPPPPLMNTTRSIVTARWHHITTRHIANASPARERGHAAFPWPVAVAVASRRRLSSDSRETADSAREPAVRGSPPAALRRRSSRALPVLPIRLLLLPLAFLTPPSLPVVVFRVGRRLGRRGRGGFRRRRRRRLRGRSDRSRRANASVSRASRRSNKTDVVREARAREAWRREKSFRNDGVQRACGVVWEAVSPLSPRVAPRLPRRRTASRGLPPRATTRAGRSSAHRTPSARGRGR